MRPMEEARPLKMDVRRVVCFDGKKYVPCDDVAEHPYGNKGLHDTADSGRDHVRDRRGDLDAEESSDAD